MKEFHAVSFDPDKCRAEIDAFGELLQSKDKLEERKDIQHFFKQRRQISAFLGTFTSDIGPANLVAYEFPFIGDYAADLVVGNREIGEYCLVELEDAKPDGVFKSAGKKATREWSSRFEHGFGQLVDWFFALDDMKKTERFAKDFGHGHVRFYGILVIGRSGGMSEYERTRLKWRAEKVRVDSHSVAFLTYDDLHAVLKHRISYFPRGSTFEKEE